MHPRRLLAALLTVPLLACGTASDGRAPADNGIAATADAGERSPAGALVAVGAPAPRYATATLRGDSLHIGPSEHVTLVNVWATWCVSCKEEFAFMDELLARYGADGLRIVAVSVDAGAVAPVEQVVRQYAPTFEIAHDPDGRIEAAYPAIGVPASYLVGRDGTLLWKRVGVLPPSVAEVIEEALQAR